MVNVFFLLSLPHTHTHIYLLILKWSKPYQKYRVGTCLTAYACTLLCDQLCTFCYHMLLWIKSWLSHQTSDITSGTAHISVTLLPFTHFDRGPSPQALSCTSEHLLGMYLAESMHCCLITCNPPPPSTLRGFLNKLQKELSIIMIKYAVSVLHGETWVAHRVICGRGQNQKRFPLLD